MKKVTVGAIAVLFLLVGFGYASAQQNNLITNMAGALTSLSLQITYESGTSTNHDSIRGPKFGHRSVIDWQEALIRTAKLLGYTYVRMIPLFICGSTGMGIFRR